MGKNLNSFPYYLLFAFIEILIKSVMSEIIDAFICLFLIKEEKEEEEKTTIRRKVQNVYA